MTQDEINALLVERGRAGQQVVRLKGGDPFVFGRGGEEAQALLDAGVPFEVVPGITSAVAVPAYAGVPVTHRGLSTSFTVVTGHEDPWAATETDWEAVARVGGTIVVLMGVADARRHRRAVDQGGLAGDTPVVAVTVGDAARAARSAYDARRPRRRAGRDRRRPSSSAPLPASTCRGSSRPADRPPRRGHRAGQPRRPAREPGRVRRVRRDHRDHRARRRRRRAPRRDRAPRRLRLDRLHLRQRRPPLLCGFALATSSANPHRRWRRWGRRPPTRCARRASTVDLVPERGVADALVDGVSRRHGPRAGAAGGGGAADARGRAARQGLGRRRGRGVPHAASRADAAQREAAAAADAIAFTSSSTVTQLSRRRRPGPAVGRVHRPGHRGDRARPRPGRLRESPIRTPSTDWSTPSSRNCVRG